MIKTTTSVFKDALALLGQNGERWIKGIDSAFTRDGLRVYCALGALQEANRDGAFSDRERLLRSNLHKMLGAPVGFETPYVHQWNDAPERTFPEVRGLFLKAIEDARRLEEATQQLSAV